MIKIAHFHEDVTPPLGHPLCAGWYPPVSAVGTRLSAHGIILFPTNSTPVVLCVLDWAKLSNFEYQR